MLLKNSPYILSLPLIWFTSQSLKNNINSMENAAESARNYVANYGYQVDGGRYVRYMSGTESKIKVYRPFQYVHSLVLGNYSLEELAGRVNEVDNINFQATMEVVLKQVEVNFERLFDERFASGPGSSYEGLNPPATCACHCSSSRKFIVFKIYLIFEDDTDLIIEKLKS